MKIGYRKQCGGRRSGIEPDQVERHGDRRSSVGFFLEEESVRWSKLQAAADDIAFDQNHARNLELKAILVELLQHEGVLPAPLRKKVETFAKLFFLSREAMGDGRFHSMSF